MPGGFEVPLTRIVPLWSSEAAVPLIVPALKRTRNVVGAVPPGGVTISKNGAPESTVAVTPLMSRSPVFVTL